MLIERSVIDIIDNSGAVKVRVFHVGGKNGMKAAKLGTIVKGSVIKASVGGKIAKRDKVNVLITATRHKIRRPDGSSISFSKNCGVVLNANKEPVGTRILGPVAREIKDLGYSKIVSQAPEVL
jgi:large subunit ribosomal protein L14